eukprot:CAMPEP_0115104122 /NCGR_PEP_ID=MMETSP0227-20121206/35078_1 /TAXON_ID=89957 /ORGANISM="Polarella glacialis, Strain CCMP 1383" /LENGTH=72 /DNA_ID=CAMNT_0002500881 /DNA_START=92 /DNA_END=310 /DNA_ORIENTATION=-
MVPGSLQMEDATEVKVKSEKRVRAESMVVADVSDATLAPSSQFRKEFGSSLRALPVPLLCVRSPNVLIGCSL